MNFRLDLAGLLLMLARANPSGRASTSILLSLHDTYRKRLPSPWGSTVNPLPENTEGRDTYGSTAKAQICVRGMKTDSRQRSGKDNQRTS